MRKVFFGLLFAFLYVSATAAQSLEFEKGRHVNILKMIRDDIKKNYYDPNYRGIPFDEHFKTAEEKLKQASSVGQLSGIIAQALADFDDSHLFYMPPGKANKTTYGFEIQMIGDRCFAVRVSESSDASKKGLAVGDEILGVENFIPTRKDLWLMNYFYRILRPQPVMNLVTRKPDGMEGRIQFEAKIVQGRKVLDLATSAIDLSNYIRQREDAYVESRKQFVAELDKKLLIWQMPAFNMSPADVDEIMEKAKDKEAIILDLRGNGGGRVDTVKRLIGHFFEKDIKVADEKTRKETKEVIAKTKGKDHYKGKVLVLMDSESGSASEVFARVMQLEKRGRVFGDLSAGAVMESRGFSHQIGLDTVIAFGVSVTIADLIMTDGKSLEKVGVMPDEVILPTGREIAAGLDPVLSAAARGLGVDLSPEQAGKLFEKQKQSYKKEF